MYSIAVARKIRLRASENADVGFYEQETEPVSNRYFADLSELKRICHMDNGRDGQQIIIDIEQSDFNAYQTEMIRGNDQNNQIRPLSLHVKTGRLHRRPVSFVCFSKTRTPPLCWGE